MILWFFFFRYLSGNLKTSVNDSIRINFYLGRASRMVQHFHGQLSGFVIEQNEELQRSSDCIRDCHQYLEIPDVQKQPGVVSKSQIN
jgi:hypothetical protein